MVRPFLPLVLCLLPLVGETARQREDANRKDALEWIRDVVMYRHAELVPKYMADSFAEHSPVLPPGREGFLRTLGQTSEPLQKAYKYPLIAAIAKGDRVLLAFERSTAARGNPSKRYTYTQFDVLRFKNGKITDHWDSAVKNPPPAFPPARLPNAADESDKPLLAENYRHETDTALDLKDMQLTLDLFRVAIGYRHVERAEEFLSLDYKQHSPNIPSGRDAFVKNFGTRPPETIKPGIPTPPTEVFAKDGMVALMFERESPDPENPGQTYKHMHFDMLKVVDGKIVEHWDEARLRE